MRRISITIILLSIAIGAYSQAPISKPYDFPIMPGTPKWESLKTNKEKLDATQIPDSILKNLTTEALIKTCINYPGFGYYVGFNNLEFGIKKVISGFNGLNELLKRPESPSLLVKFYKKMAVNKSLFKDKDISSEFWILRQIYFEMIIAQDEIINSLSESEKLDLIVDARNKFEIKKQQGGKELNHKILSPTILIMGKILDHSDNMKLKTTHNESFQKFVSTSMITDESVINDILSLTDEYIKSNK